jgi:molybdenum cofactor cytidylyltransferase
MKIGCILLSAGTGLRFGSDKLLSTLIDRPLIDYILSSLPVAHFDEIVAVVSSQEVKERVQRHKIKTVYNYNPDEGISSSIRLGIKALNDVDACMFCVSDQPLLQSDTIIDMINVYKKDSIYSLSHNAVRGNPVIFPSSLFGELSELKKGEFGTKVIYAHQDMLMLHETDDKTQLIDVDTPENLDYIRSIIIGKTQ